MSETYTKKEILKKKILKKKIKEEKRALKKTHNNKGKSLEEMFVYVDYNGHLTDVPPHLQVNPEEKPAKKLYKGVVTHLNEKGFGFIKENETNDNVFFSINVAFPEIKIKDEVEFSKTKGERGFKALQVKKEY